MKLGRFNNTGTKAIAPANAAQRSRWKRFKGSVMINSCPCKGQPMRKTGEHIFGPSGIDAESPTIGDIHTVYNALTDRASVSIHVFGVNIGGLMRRMFSLANGAPHALVSGYANTLPPDIWDRSRGAMPDAVPDSGAGNSGSTVPCPDS